MAQPAAPPSDLRNRLLKALPPEEVAKLLPRLAPVDLAFRQVLQAPEEPMPAAWFIESGIVSMLATLEDGDGAEVGMVGPEGMIGLPLLLDDDRDGRLAAHGHLVGTLPWQPGGPATRTRGPGPTGRR